MQEQETDYYKIFMEILSNENNYEKIIDLYYEKLGKRFLLEFPRKVASYHNISGLIIIKKDIIKYCKKKYRNETNWWYKDENRKGVIGIILAFLGIVITLLKIYLDYNKQVKTVESSTEINKANDTVIVKRNDFIKIEKQKVSIDTSSIAFTDYAENSFIVIDTVSIIMYEPGINEVEDLRVKAEGEDAFDQVVMDNQYYQFQVEEYFKKKPVKIIHTDAEKFIFKHRNGKESVILRDSLEYKWGTIIFNTMDAPKQIDETGDYEQFSKPYFKWK